jgi:hypothetical protein
MSLSLRKGNVIGMLVSKTNKKYDGKLLRINVDPDEGEPELSFSKDVSIQILPRVDIEGEKYYISAPSGAGKSYFISKWLAMNRKIWRGKNKKTIYIFSRIKHDKQLDKYSDVIRPDLDDLVDDPIEMEELENDIVIYDDIDSVRNKHVKEAVFSQRDDHLVCGRHANLTVICTSHQLMNHNESKRCINESTSVVLFPLAGNVYQLTNFLKSYCGFSKLMIAKIMNLKSRWICIFKTYPMCIVYDHGAFVANLKF